MDPDRVRAFPFVAPAGAAPFFIRRAEGVHLFAPDRRAPSGERAILDAAGSGAVVSIGHGRRGVATAIADASVELTHALPYFATRTRVELVERLRGRWLPAGMTRALFTAGGSEAVDAALRVARLHHVAAGRPGRWKVIGRNLSFHGPLLSSLAICGDAPRRRDFGPWLPDMPRAPSCYCLRCELGREWPECGVACATELDSIIEREGPDTVAAFIAEGIGGATIGSAVPPQDYWAAIEAVCRRHGVVLVVDEVMTGFGRTGRPMAVDHWGLVPDILVAGKGLASGYAPIGAVFTTESIVEPIVRSGREFALQTYAGHPGSCAAAGAVLRVLEEERLIERAARQGGRLGSALRRFESHPHVAAVRGTGLLHSVEIVADRATNRPFPAAARVGRAVVARGLARNVLFYAGGCEPAPDVITLAPPFIVEDHHIEHMVEVLEQSIDAAVAIASR